MPPCVTRCKKHGNRSFLDGDFPCANSISGPNRKANFADAEALWSRQARLQASSLWPSFRPGPIAKGWVNALQFGEAFKGRCFGECKYGREETRKTRYRSCENHHFTRLMNDYLVFPDIYSATTGVGSRVGNLRGRRAAASTTTRPMPARIRNRVSNPQFACTNAISGNDNAKTVNATT